MSTDDLLDEATRLADSDWPPAALTIPVLRALIERVQQAEAERDDLALLVNEHRDALGRKHTYQQSVEAERDSWHQAALTATAGESRAERERDEARGKLDDVRARLDSWDATALRDVLAILDD